MNRKIVIGLSLIFFFTFTLLTVPTATASGPLQGMQLALKGVNADNADSVSEPVIEKSPAEVKGQSVVQTAPAAEPGTKAVNPDNPSKTLSRS